MLPPKKIMKDLAPDDQKQEIFSLGRYYTLPWKLLYLKRLKLALRLLGEKKYKNLLDIGFGSGIFFPSLSQKADNLFGIDMHDYHDRVSRLLSQMGVKAELKKGSILEIPYEENRFDCVICLSVLEFIENTEKALEEISRVAVPDAKIILGMPAVNKLTDFCYALLGKGEQNKKHASTHKKIITLAKKYFEVKKIKTIPGLFYIISAKNKK